MQTNNPLPIPVGIWLFELQENLTPGGTANAVEMFWNGSTFVDSGIVRVIHDSSGVAALPAGSRVYCFFNQQAQQWHPITSQPSTFMAILFDRRSFFIEEESSMIDQLTWTDPMFDGYGGNCSPAFPKPKRGEWSWVQAEEFTESNGMTADFGRIGVWVPKEGGFCGIMGECDAAHELNRSNAAVEIEYMTVKMTVGIAPKYGTASDCSSWDSSSGSGSSVIISPYEEVVIDIKGRIVTAIRLKRRVWFDLGLPREDCAKPYFVSLSEDNDTP